MNKDYENCFKCGKRFKIGYQVNFCESCFKKLSSDEVKKIEEQHYKSKFIKIR